MSDNDRQMNGQPRQRNAPDTAQLPPGGKGKQRLTRRLQTAWRASWEEGGFLYQRWEEVSQVRHADWHEIAHWIKAAGLLAGISLLVITVDTAGNITNAALKSLSDVPASSTGDGTGLWGTVDHPIRVFLTEQAAHLAVTPGALYAFWHLTGLLSLVGGFLGSAGARITWALFGCSGLAMVWSASPAGGRAAATGLAALMWALASIVALRGLTLRPIVHNHPPQYQFSPALHLHAAIPSPAPAGDNPDIVRQLQR